MGKSTPRPPEPVDPVKTAAAQTASNTETARLQQKLNAVNSYGPQGSVTYEQYAPDRWSQTTTLSPQEQQSYDLSKAAENAAYGVANQQIGRVGDALGQTLNYEGLPELAGTVGPSDFSADRQAMADAVYGQATSRLDPMFATQQNQLDTRLANQGLSMNSAAYQNAQDQFGRTRNDAYNQAGFSAIQAGSQEQDRLFNRQLQQGQFQNQARTQGGQERAYVQNQPLNQFGALMSGGQVGMPQGVQYTPTSVAPTDVLGAYALNQQGQNANYQARLANQQAGLSGLYSLGAAGITAFSDRRLKHDIVKMGTRADGLGVYAYRYLWSPIVQIGVMAQEVLRIKPHAVVTTPSGYMAVNYGAL